MPAWIYVVAAAAVVFVFWFGWARRWWHGARYSWTRARHLVDLTETEVIPGTEYGSMIYADDPHGPEIVARVARYGDIAGTPGGLTWGEATGQRDWREQTMADLNPDTLDTHYQDPPSHNIVCAYEPDRCPWPDGRPSIDSGPGDAVSSRPPGPVPPSRLADTGDVLAAHEAHPSPDWLDGQLADLFAWVRSMHVLEVP